MVNAMLTIKQASELLKLSSSLLYALCASGKIAHHRCGLGRGTIRITKKALEDYLDRSKVTEPVLSEGSKCRQPFKHVNAERLRLAWRRLGVG